MKPFRSPLVIAACCATLLVACERQPSPSDASGPVPIAPIAPAAPAAPTAPGASTPPHDAALRGKALEVANTVRMKLEKQNIGIGDQDGLPKAEITPQGEFLVAGKRVETDAAQRTLLLRYRSQIIDMAAAGSAIGVQGADIGISAAGDAVKSLFTGNTDDIEKNASRQADALKDQARKLCDALPAMRRTQQALSESLPAFAPYAKMDEKNGDDCKVE